MTESIQYGLIWEAEERAETWKPIPGATKYEVSDKGRVRRGGHVLAQSVKNGYWQVKYTDDTGKRRDGVTVHRLVLLAFAGRPQKGQESCHGEQGQLCNWWPENLRWDTKKANEADKPEPPQPTFPCRNAPTCGNMNMNEDRRCPKCSDAEGRKIARKLNAGMNLEVAAVQSGLSSDWAFKIAVKAGGYRGTIRQARLQSPSVRQRLAITLRDRRPDGWGDAA